MLASVLVTYWGLTHYKTRTPLLGQVLLEALSLLSGRNFNNLYLENLPSLEISHHLLAASPTFHLKCH